MIKEFPTDTTSIEGEGVFFKVAVRGYPQPSLTWYHENSSGSAEREVRLTVRQEEEEAAPVDRERVEIQPVPEAEFGDYVAYCHSDANKVFKLQYNVTLPMLMILNILTIYF